MVNEYELLTRGPLCDINKKRGKALLNLSVLAGGIVKTLLYVTAICLFVFVMGVLPVQSQPQTFEGYTVISGPLGPQVCMGRWVPSKDVALPGVCEGQLVDVAQFTAMYTKASADRLDQVILLLGLMDQKMAISIDQMNRLIESMVKTQTAVEQQTSQTGEILQETITRRFDALSEEILASEQFRDELFRLKEDILKEVEKRYPVKPATPKK